jgi:hypothetical protein
MQEIFRHDPEFAHYFQDAQLRTGGGGQYQSPQSGPKRKNFVQNAQRTRHARRIYVGGIPPSCSRQDELRES